MQNIKYLTEKQVIAINVKAIQELSPKEQVGVKVPEVLNATIEGVKQSFGGVELYETIERKAAFIYRNIVQNMHSLMRIREQLLHLWLFS